MRLQKAPGTLPGAQRCHAPEAKKGPDEHCPPLGGTPSSAGTQVFLPVPQGSRASSDSPGPRSLPPPHSLGWLGKEVVHGGHSEAYGGRSAEGRSLSPRASIRVSERVGTCPAGRRAQEGLHVGMGLLFPSCPSTFDLVFEGLTPSR